MSESLRLDAIEFTAGTQVREAINEAVVATYADLLGEGTEFPAVIVFHDGSHYFLADGFHRGMAHSRLGRDTIVADVRIGTREDALWFALGANSLNGYQLTDGDKKHAITLAFTTWPDRSQNQIAEQIGCTQRYVSKVLNHVRTSSNLIPTRVIGKDGKSYPASPHNGSVNPKRADVERLVRDGAQNEDIRQQVKTSKALIADVRREVVSGSVDKSRAAVDSRLDRMREMAAGGYSTHQIATELGLSEKGLRETLRREEIAVPAERVMGHTRRHDANRIVEQMVIDAENLTADVNLINFRSLDKERLGAWIDSLGASRRALDAFVKRLIKEMKNDEAA